MGENKNYDADGCNRLLICRYRAAGSTQLYVQGFRNAHEAPTTGQTTSASIVWESMTRPIVLLNPVKLPSSVHCPACYEMQVGVFQVQRPRSARRTHWLGDTAPSTLAAMCGKRLLQADVNGGAAGRLATKPGPA